MKFTLLSLTLALSLPASCFAASLSDWMNNVDDSVPLTNITIPGTHDSGATHEPVSGIAKTQNLSISDQLKIGVRYLDIRLRHYGDALVVHHGSVYQHLNFDNVLQSVTDFLSIHPSETVIMEVSQEYKPANNTRTFEQTFVQYKNRSQYSKFWWGHSYLPKLGEARGKIVLLRRFAGSFWTSGGIDISRWSDNAEFTIKDSRNTPIHVQDYYKVSASSNDNKWQAVYKNMNAAKSSNGEMYLNFTSGYRPILGIPNIPGVANDINQRLISYFNGQNAGNHHYGVIISDFTSADLTRAELKSYF
ncbi:1-phosphatidylinositol phosphodiesterase precursor [Vibrio aerogenes CECT 7868]|uniref:1-phosphatidylinositol phosphodiesterase n=1 Tax=Vibrio aerogenes CECT 7868 TaxID=1216006 RepID=A0A1M5VUR7_9VIBR|nr:phosphatidylinositol-specific phospholipase C [Vibrio aerogenes]SHH78920.1 1-phosphatidylinositol phosphodiesterase precursor [Vibrio aerogenes CECT 7868]